MFAAAILTRARTCPRTGACGPSTQWGSEAHSAAKDGLRASTFRRSVTEQSQRQTESGRGQWLQGGGLCLKGAELQPRAVEALGVGGSWGCTATVTVRRGVPGKRLRGYAYVACLPAEKRHGDKSYGAGCACLSPVGSRTHPGSSRAAPVKGHSCRLQEQGSRPPGLRGAHLLGEGHLLRAGLRWAQRTLGARGQEGREGTRVGRPLHACDGEGTVLGWASGRVGEMTDCSTKGP